MRRGRRAADGTTAGMVSVDLGVPDGAATVGGRRATSTGSPVASRRAAGDDRSAARDLHGRLLGLSAPARRFVAGAVACGALAAAAVVVQAWGIAAVVGDVADGRAPAWGGPLLLVLGAAVARAALAGGTELLGRRAAEHATHELRSRIARKALAGRSGHVPGARRGEIAAAAVEGVDALADYHARALPALALAAVVPVAVVAIIAWRSPVVGALLAVTIPVVVVFMVLVGRASAEHARERRHATAVLGAHFLEVVRGLPTLRAHGREDAQVATLAAVSERHRAESLGALRVAFLSAYVLEFLAMLGTAIAAATVGVLLAEGHMDLETGLFVLLLAPEVYAPLRTAGQRFHAAEDGATAAARVLEFLDEPEPRRAPGDTAAVGVRGPASATVMAPGPALQAAVGPATAPGSASATVPAVAPVMEPAAAAPVPDPARRPMRLSAACVAGGAGRPAALAALDLELPAGRTIALVGPSGIGKSTLLALLARLRDPDEGTVRCGAVDLADVPVDAWWSRIAWLPQRPGLAAARLDDALAGREDVALGGRLDDALPGPEDAALAGRLDDALPGPEDVALAGRLDVARVGRDVREETPAGQRAGGDADPDVPRPLGAAAAREGDGSGGATSRTSPVAGRPRRFAPRRARNDEDRAMGAPVRDVPRPVHAAARFVGASDVAVPSDVAVRPVDDDRLARRLRAVGAGPVLATMPDGLATVVGAGGRSLSAGQTQRLALAGVLASRAPLVLLDEPTAHLDHDAARQATDAILAACAGRTLVVATHDPALAARCDVVVDLAEALRLAPAATDARWPGALAGDDGAGTDDEDADRGWAGLGVERRRRRRKGLGRRTAVRAAPRASGPAASPAEPGRGNPTRAAGPAASPADPAPADPATPRVRPPASVAPQGPPTPAWRPVAFAVLGAATALAVLGTSGWLVTRASERPPVLALLCAIVVVRALGLIRAHARYAERLSSHERALGELGATRVRWYRRIARRVGAPGVPGSADLLTRFTTDVDELQHHGPRVVLPRVAAAAGGGLAILATTAVLPAAGGALGAGLLLAGVVAPALAGRMARRALGPQGAARAVLARDLDDALAHGTELAVRGRGPARVRDLIGASRELGRLDRRHARAAAVGQTATTLCAGVGAAAVLVVGAHAAADGGLSLVLLGALVLLALGAGDLVLPLPEASMRAVAIARARARLADVVDGPPLLADPPAPPVALPDRGALVAHGLRHRPGGPGTPLVLDAVDLALRPGERVALIGPSGAGKSTLATLLARLADPDEGEVLLVGGSGVVTDADGAGHAADADVFGGAARAAGAGSADIAVRLADADPADVRRRVRLAGQDAHLFATSVRENVRIGAPGVGDDRVDAALRTAGLGPWLDALPAGLDTLVGEDGVAVSGGERQRLGLARAVASPADVLLLDEPTAMLDPPTAASVLADVLAATAGRSVLVVTHAGAGLDAFDRVLELRDGRVRERRGGRVSQFAPHRGARPRASAT